MSPSLLVPPENAYSRMLGTTLRPRPELPWRVLDLFAGAGGLALGFEAQGFHTEGFEADEDCCTSYRKNLRSPCNQVYLTAETKFSRADVVIGGPPCQPFSVSGEQRGEHDARNGFPAFIRAVEQAKPKLWMIENVKGILYRNREYFEQVLHSLAAMG